MRNLPLNKQRVFDFAVTVEITPQSQMIRKRFRQKPCKKFYPHVQYIKLMQK
jgi:hypothetical protein